MKRILFLFLFLFLFLPAICFAANDDISDRPELGTAVSGDSLLGVDASQSAGARLRRILFSGDSADILSGAGTWVSSIGIEVDSTITASGTNPVRIGLADTAVTPGDCTNCDLSINAKGQITAAANGTGGTGAVTITTDLPDAPGEMNLNDTTHVLSIASATGITTFGSDSFTAWDTTPTAFSFTDQTNVGLSTAITSTSITVADINYPAAISVTGGTYDINTSGTFTSNAGTVVVGDTVRARHTSSSSNSTATDTVVTIGGVDDTFTSTTEAAGSCLTQAVLYTSVVNDTTSPAQIWGNVGTGLAIVGDGRELYSVKMRVTSRTGSTDNTATMYLTNSATWSGSYLETASVTIPGSDTEFTATFAGTSVLTNGVTYYIFVSDPSRVYEERFYLSAGYATANLYHSGNITTTNASLESGKRLYGEVQVCAD